jgi:glutamine synthetase
VPVEVSPRQILRRQMERAAERGLRVCSATELEFFLFKDSYEEADAKGWKGLTPHTSTIEDYQLLQTTREEYILRRIRNEMRAADIPVEFSKGEAGRGQHEVNVTYDEALVTADRHLVFKNGIKEIAAQEGRAATFMAKWTMDDVGSSCHVHTSLWDAESGDPLMADASHPSGLSTVGRRFLAGQLHAARELAWCAAPTVNSYRRYVPGSWAPTAAVYGEDNRTCGFRLVGHGAGRRVESRIPGADVNPYLVLAAAIAAGLYGIDHELEPGDPYARNAYEATDVPRIPSTLVEAIDELRRLHGGGRGVRPRRAPSPPQHGRAGVAGVQPPRDGLGAGPELRAHLRLAAAPAGPTVGPADHAGLPPR